MLKYFPDVGSQTQHLIADKPREAAAEHEERDADTKVHVLQCPRQNVPKLQ